MNDEARDRIGKLIRSGADSLTDRYDDLIFSRNAAASTRQLLASQERIVAENERRVAVEIATIADLMDAAGLRRSGTDDVLLAFGWQLDHDGPPWTDRDVQLRRLAASIVEPESAP